MKTEQLFKAMTDYYTGSPKQIQHLIKVHSFAMRIGLAEQLDEKTLNILETAAIVHDIGIKPATEKYGVASGKYQEIEGPPVAREMLEKLGYPQDIIERVCFLVAHHHTYDEIRGIDYQILIEADFLVNLYEGNRNKDDIISTRDKIFRTKHAIFICNTMFGI